jgi:hypothetical protein
LNWCYGYTEVERERNSTKERMKKKEKGRELDHGERGNKIVKGIWSRNREKMKVRE